VDKDRIRICIAKTIREIGKLLEHVKARLSQRESDVSGLLEANVHPEGVPAVIPSGCWLTA
jgi:hypothetical protein